MSWLDKILPPKMQSDAKKSAMPDSTADCAIFAFGFLGHDISKKCQFFVIFVDSPTSICRFFIL